MIEKIYKVNGFSALEVGQQYDHNATKVTFSSYDVEDASNTVYLMIDTLDIAIPLDDSLSFVVQSNITRDVTTYYGQLREFHMNGDKAELVKSSNMFKMRVSDSIDNEVREVTDPSLDLIYAQMHQMYITIKNAYENHDFDGKDYDHSEEFERLSREITEHQAEIERLLNQFNIDAEAKKDALKRELNAHEQELERNLTTFTSEKTGELERYKNTKVEEFDRNANNKTNDFNSLVESANNVIDNKVSQASTSEQNAKESEESAETSKARAEEIKTYLDANYGNIQNQLAEKMEKHLLDYDGAHIKENGITLSFDELYNILMNSEDFAVLVYNGFAYHPNGVNTTQIVFSSSYPVNGLDVNHRITMLKNGTITKTDATDENVINKVDSITESNKNNTTKYTSVKAVNDLVEATKTQLSESIVATNKKITDMGLSVVDGQLCVTYKEEL